MSRNFTSRIFSTPVAASQFEIVGHELMKMSNLFRIRHDEYTSLPMLAFVKVFFSEFNIFLILFVI